MKLESLLKTQLILCQQKINSKKALLEQLSIMLAKNLNKEQQSQIFDSFIEREQLGSTALGYGVAIPHIRSKLFNQTQVAIIQLQKPINFEAEDQRPVDIIIALIASDHDNQLHLNLLAQCSNLLTQSEIRQQFRQAKTANEILNIIKQKTPHAESI